MAGALTTGNDGGVVTFIDVLGWKGVYQRKTDAIGSLTSLIEGARSQVVLQRGMVKRDTEIKSISDTVAIFTKCDEEEATKSIEIHGRLAQWMIPQSIRSGIPVRGVIAYGDFELSNDIFVGKAVDEAASWHAHSDWIGVHLTPSAEYVMVNGSSNPLWIKYNPPGKFAQKWVTHCVNWTSNWRDPDLEVSKLKDLFRELGPITPEISIKFSNTLNFVHVARPAVAIDEWFI